MLNIFKKLNRTLILAVLLPAGLLLFGSAVQAQYWVSNPASCPSTYAGFGQSCPIPGEVICGVNGSNNIECYNPASLTAPAASSTSIVNQDTAGVNAGTFNGGLLINCYAYDAAAPFCNNSGAYFCDRNSTCYTTNNRQTVCTENVFGAYTCGACRTNYYDCDGNAANCELLNGSACTGGTWNGPACSCTCDAANFYFDKDGNNTSCEFGGPNVGGLRYHYTSTATSSAVCNTNYLDCNSDLTEANINASTTNGCEIQSLSACTTAYGSAGVYMGCNCVGSTMNFETGTEAKYATDTPFLWGTQFGTGPLMKLISNNASTTGGIFFIGNGGEVGIGTSTTNPANALTVGYNANSQFIINKSGVVSAGTWNGGVIGIQYGGTATSTWTANSLVFANAENSLGQILPGNNGQVLVMNGSGVPVWSNTAASTPHGLLSSQHPDSDESGAPARGELMVASSTNLWSALALGNAGYILYSNGSDPIWQSFNNLWDTRLLATTTDALAEGILNHYYSTELFAIDLSGTTTDALPEGAINRYWSDALFDARLSATTTLPNILSLSGLTTIGNITSGTWNADTITVSRGGTGLTAAASGYVLAGLDATSMQATSSLYIASNGNVGIGTTTPQNKLVVNGTGQFGSLCFGGSCISGWGEAGNLDATSTVAGQIAFWHDADTLTATSVLSILYGGTGATTASDARANLGLAIGSQVQGWDLSLDAISGLATSSGNFMIADGSNWSSMSSSSAFTALNLGNMALQSPGNVAITGGSISGITDLAVSDGGTGRSAWTQYAIPYMSDATTFGQIGIGGANYVLSVNGSGNGYAWIEASSTGMSVETLQDYVGAMIGTSTNITVVYNDNVDGRIEFTVADAWYNSLADMTLNQGLIYAGDAANHPAATSSIYISTNSNVGIGTTTATERLTVDGNLLINGDIIPKNGASTDIGSWGNRVESGFFTNLDVVNMTIGSTSISGSASNMFTINSDATADEDSILAYYRGSSLTAGQLTWNSGNDSFSFNYPLGLENQGDLRFYEASAGTDYVALRASSTLGSSLTWILPTTQGTAGQALLTDAYGHMFWGDPAGNGTIASGTPGYVPFYNAYGNALTATSSIYIDGLSNVGIGSTSPSEKLSVNGRGAFNGICLGGVCISNWGGAGVGVSGPVPGAIVTWLDANTLTASSVLSLVYGGTGATTANQARTNLGLAIGSDIQAWNTNLATIAGLSTSTNNFMIANGANWTSVSSSSAFTALNLGNLALQSPGNVAITGGSISGITDLAVSDGGTGRSAWTQYAIPYMSDTTTFGQIGIGTANYVLSVNGGANGYTWVPATSTGMTQETLEDYVGAMIGTSTNITVVYNDNVDGRIEFTVADIWYNSLADMTLNQGLIYAGDAANHPTATSSIYISTNSNVGIGTSTPASRLTVAGQGAFTGLCLNGNCISDWNGAGSIDATSTVAGQIVTWYDTDTLTASSVLSLVYGGTGATTANQARTNLGLAIGSDIQAWNTNLATIAGLSTSTNNFMIANGANWTSVSSSSAFTALNLGNLALQSPGNVAITGGSISGITDLAVSDGGTGRSAWTQYAIPYMSDTTTFGQIGIGTANYVLSVNGGANGYTWVPATSTGMTQETLEDYVGAMIGTSTNITVVYNDNVDGRIEFTVADIWYNSLADMTLNQGLIYAGDAANHPTATSSIYISANSNVGIGTTTATERLTVDGNLLINGDIIPRNGASTDIGSWGNRVSNGFFTNLDVTNMTIGSTSISGSISNIFTINSDTTVDEDSTLAFYRGGSLAQAQVTWDSDNDILSMNFPLGMEDGNELRLYEDLPGTDYVALKSSSTLASSIILTLPTASGTASNALMWGTDGQLFWDTPSGTGGTVGIGNTGWIPFYGGNGVDDLTATSSIFVDTNSYVGIGSTSPSKLLTVAGGGSFEELCLGGVCYTNWASAGSIDGSGSDGAVTIWSDPNTLTSSSTLAVTVGGTGKSAWTPYAIPYAVSANTLGEIAIGSSTYLLSVNATGDGFTWVAASSTGTVLSQEEVQDYVGPTVAGNTETLITVTYDDDNNQFDYVVDSNLNNYSWSNVGVLNLTAARGGTGWNSSASSGIAVINNGVWGASTTLPIYLGGTGLSSSGLNQILLGNSSGGYSLTGTSSLGLVTSVGLSVPTGFTISGSPITTNGTLVIGFDGNYNLPLTASTTNWNTAYNWGNHATAGYLSQAYASSTYSTISYVQGLSASATSSLLAYVGGLSQSASSTFSTYAYINNLSASATSSLYSYVSGLSASATSTFATSTHVQGVGYGGTGRSAWTQYAIPYMSDTTTFGQIGIGTANYVLSVNGGANGYTWVPATSTGMTQEVLEDYVGAMIGTTTRITVAYEDNNGKITYTVDNDLNNYSWTNIGTAHLTAARGGTGWNSSASSGIAIINNGVWGASTTLPVTLGGTGLASAGLNQILLGNSSGGYSLTGTSSLGLVTSVGLSVPTGFTISGSPITTNGTLVIGFDGNYNLPLTASTTNWNTAYNWGNHAAAGYLSQAYASSTYSTLNYVQGLSASATSSLLSYVGGLSQSASSTFSTYVYINSLSASATSSLLAYVSGLSQSASSTFSTYAYINNLSASATSSLYSYVSGLSASATSTFATSTHVQGVGYGGTGRSAWTQYAIPYMSDTTTFGQIGIGAANYVLSVNGGANGYTWVPATSTGMTQEVLEDYVGAMIGTTTRITVAYEDNNGKITYTVDNDLNNYSWTNIGTAHLTAARGGTGWNSSASSGIAIINSGVWGASSTLPIYLGGTGTSTVPASGQLLLGNASGGYTLTATSGLGFDNYVSWTAAGNSGSVIATSGANLTFSGSAGLTTAVSGNTITISPSGLYNIPLTASTTNWNTAFNWGNHALAGYLSQAYASSTFSTLSYVQGLSASATSSFATYAYINNLSASATSSLYSYVSGLSASATSTFATSTHVQGVAYGGTGTTSPYGILTGTGSGIVSRSINGTVNQITMANGDGIAGNPTISLPDAVYLGTNGKIGRDATDLIDFDTDNQITFRTNNTDRMILDSNGYLGIGTTTPSNALTILSSSGAQLRLGYDANNYVNFMVDNAGQLSISSSNLATTTMGSGDEAMRIDANGNVGIGTTSPLSKLDIYGNLMLSGSDRYLNFGTTSGETSYGLRDLGGTIQVKNANGSWSGIGAGATGLDDLNDVTITSAAEGEILMYSTGAWRDMATSTLGFDNYAYWRLNGNSGTLNATSTAILTLVGGSGLTTSISGNTITIATATGFIIPTNTQVSDWNAVVASSTFYNTNSNLVASNYLAWNAVAASSTFYNQAYNWGNHALAGYFATSTGSILEVAYGGTGSSSPYGILTGTGSGIVSRSINGTVNQITMANGDGIAGNPTISLPSAVYLGASGQIGRDGDNLIDFSTDNQIGFNTNGTLNMLLDTSGNLMLGTSTPGAKLTVMSTTGAQLRLAYDENNYVNMTVASDGRFTINNPSAAGSQITLGNGTAADSGVVFNGNANRFWLGIDDTDDAFHIGTSTLIGSSSVLTILNNGYVGIGIDNPTEPLYVAGNINATGNIIAGIGGDYLGLIAGNPDILRSYRALSIEAGGAIERIRISDVGDVGIGTSAPLASLDVYGDMILSGADRYLNFGSATSSNGYGFRDVAGVLQYRDSAGTWATFSTSTGSVATGNTGWMPYYSATGTALTATSAIYISPNGNVGIGQSDPGVYKLNVNGELRATSLTLTNGNGVSWGNTSIRGANESYMDIQTAGASRLYITGTGEIGIGTTSPQSMLTVAGDMKLTGTDRYMNFGADYTTGTSSYGFRDNAGQMQFKNLSGEWVNIGSAGSSGALGSLSDVSVSSPQDGDILTYLSGSWINASTTEFVLDDDFSGFGIMVRTANNTYATRYATGTLNEIVLANGDGVADNITIGLPDVVYLGSAGKIGRDADNLVDFSADNQITWRTNGTDNMILNANGYLGIGTTTPDYKLTVFGSGNLFRVATSGGDVFTITDTQITSYVPHSFAGSGDVDIAGDLYLSNTSASNINSYGPMYLTAGDAGTDNNLYLEGRGTGAVYVDDALTVTGTTTMASWNKVISVDGVTYPQNSTGIQAAINSLPAGGGKVFLPAGTYSITATVTIPSFVWLEGAGASSTVLRLADNTNTSVITNSDWTNGNSYIKISNLKIDGNDAGNTGAECSGVYLDRVSYSEISQLYIYDAEDVGVGFDAQGSSFEGYNKIINNYFESNGNDGLFLQWNKYSVVNGNTFKNNGNGIYTISDNLTISNNTIYNSDFRGIGLVGDNNSVTGNIIDDCGTYGIDITTGSAYNTISNNIINNNGGSGDDSGIILNTGDYNVIANNRITDTAGTGYAIDIRSGSDNNTLSGNQYSGAGAQSINDLGTNTTYNQPERLAIRTTATTSPVSYPAIYAIATTTGTLVDLRQTGTGDIMNLFASTSAEVFTVLGNGNVGIGTDNPQEKLELSKNDDLALFITNTIGASTAVYSEYNRGGIGTLSDHEFEIVTNNIQRMIITPTGEIGIGTTSPQSMLTVAGDMKLTGTDRYMNFGADYTTGTSSYGFRDNAGTMQYKNLSGEWVNIGSAGSSGSLGSMSDVNVSSAQPGDILTYSGGSWINTATTSFVIDNEFSGTGLMVRTAANTYTARTATGTPNEITVVNGDGILGDPTISLPDVVYLGTNGQIGRDGNTLIDFSTNNQIGFNTNGTLNMLLDSTGNLMIGTSSAAAKLTVMSSDANGQLRLAYDTDTFVDFKVLSDGQFVIEGSGLSGSLLTIGDGSAEDAGFVIDGNGANDFWMALDNSEGHLAIGTSSTIGSSTILNILSNGRIGIGSSSPNYNFTVNGSLYATDIYTSSSTYWMDGKRVLSLGTGLNLYNTGETFYTSLRASSTQGANLDLYLPGSDGSAGQVLKTDGAGHLYFANADATSDLWQQSGSNTYFNTGNVSIGTSTPTGIFNVASSTTGSNLFVINSAGNVGIGTDNLDGLLVVQKNQNAWATVISKNETNDASAGAEFVTQSASSYGYFSAYPSSYSQTNFADRIGVGAYTNSSGLDLLAEATTGDMRFYTGGSNVNNERMRIDANGRIGIGTTTLSNIFTVASSTTGSNLFVINEAGNVGIGTGNSLHSYTDGLEVRVGSADTYPIQITSPGGTELGGIYYPTGGSLMFKMADSGYSTRVVFDTDGNSYLTGGNFGIGTTAPTHLLEVTASSTDYLFYIYNSSQMASSSGLSVRVDGDGPILNLNSNGTDVVTITGANTTFNNPVIFGAAGDVSMAYDLIFSNDSSGNIIFSNGPGYIKTESGWENLNLTLSAANLGEVVVDDEMIITGTTTIDDLIYFNTQDNRIGIGTSTPNAALSIATTSSSTLAMFTVRNETGTAFRINADGSYAYDQTGTTPAADYAEYFRTNDTDLKSGEAVCVDVANNNTVNRCERGADDNVMGIVSTKPAILGNAKDEYVDNINYKAIAMLGQIPALVSTENGEIRPGDSLTSASRPGYMRKAAAGEPTVGVALEKLGNSVASLPEISSSTPDEVEYGMINVLISRRNKSLTVESVEQKITEHIAAMEIEDEVAIMLQNAINDYNIASSVEPIVNEQIASFDSRLTVAVNGVTGELANVTAGIDNLISRMAALELRVTSYELQLSGLGEIDHRISALEELDLASAIAHALAEETTGSSSQEAFSVTADGSIVFTNDSEVKAQIVDSQSTSTVAVYESEALVEIITATTSDVTAFVINQKGTGDVADFRAGGVSIVNIADDGKVSVVGEMAIDGRLMVCSGAGCGEALDSAVDSTLGDMGVEGTVVAGAFAGYCDDGYVWVPGSAKYGTMPGFCVETNEHEFMTNEHESRMPWVNVTQGEADLTCQAIGDGYHLISENEWLTIAENAIRVSKNDCDDVSIGLQLPAFAYTDEHELLTNCTNHEYVSTTSIGLVLSNDNIIYDLVGGVGEWTNQIVTQAGIFEPIDNDWHEYFEISDFKGFNINPPYYYSSDNGIGRVKTGDNAELIRGFVRGASALYDLDTSYSPAMATSTIGFRCAR